MLPKKLVGRHFCKVSGGPGWGSAAAELGAPTMSQMAGKLVPGRPYYSPQNADVDSDSETAE